VGSLTRALVGLGLVGLVLIGIAVALTLGSDHMSDRGASAAIGGAIMAAWMGTGLYAWWRRPHNRVGALMAATGFVFFLQSFAASNSSFFFSVGLVTSSAFLAVAVHMLLAFPTGRIPTTAQKRLMAAVYTLALAVPLGYALFTRECVDCFDGADVPDNAFLIADAPSVAEAIDVAGSIVAVVLVGGIAAVLVRRWRAATVRERRSLAPVLLTGAAMVALLALLLAIDVVFPKSDAVMAVNHAALAAFAALPFAFLAGLRRSRSWRAGAVVELVETLGEAPARGDLRDALAEALGDPTLELAYWLPEQRRYVDPAGRRVTLPPEGDAERAATEVEREGRRVGALVHSVALCDEPDLIRAVAVAAALALDNERLDAELRARVEELRDSRQRLLDATLAERRRLERDLHDGAQQRLVSLSLQLSLIDQQLGRGPADVPAARELLGAARGEVRAALEDLRELARGIHPAVLTDRGLAAALEALADRAPVPVEVAALPAERLPGAVEAAAYFVVAESLTNVAKYAHASHAEVRVGRENGVALVEVRDDGVGGADPSAGSGLRGLADRLEALDGRLEIESAPGRGTSVRARIPCG
jgi:signal transduction histidine kinase